MPNTLPRSIRLTFLAAMCLALSVLGCSRDTPEKFIASGKSFLGKGEYSAAAIQFKNAVQKAPSSGEARYLLGFSLAQAQDLGSAEIELRKALSAGYDPDLVYPALVRVLLEQGQFEQALKETQSAKDGNLAKGELLALAGEAQFGLRKPQEARAAFAAALQVDPSNDTATLGMAKMAAIDHNFPRAHQLVEEVLARSSSSVEAVLLKGDLLLAEQRNKEAAQAYAKAIELRPQRVRGYLSLVPILVRERDLDAARARVSALRKIAPKAIVTSYLDALVLYSAGDRPHALEAIQSVLRAAPDYVPALLLAGAIEHDSGRYAQAEDHLGKVISAVPGAIYPLRLLVSTYLRDGQLDRAQESVTKLIELSPNDSAALSLAGQVALAKREVAKAAEYYQKALSMDPNNALTRTRLGQARLAAGDTQNAIHDLEAASAADTSQYQADVALFTLYLSRKELDKAQLAADALANKQPDNPLTHNLKGLLQLAKKDQPAARSSFERALQLQPTYLPATNNLATLDLADGKPEAAKQRYEAILTKDPKREEALLALVALLQQTGAPSSDIEKAIDRAVTANPGTARTRLVQISYLRQKGDPKAVLTAAQQAQAAAPEDPQVLKALGRAQLAAGEHSQAITTFGKLAALMPKSTMPLLEQGQAYAVAKDWAGARQAFQKALKLQPDLALAQLGLVRVALQSGNFKEAQAEARSMQKLRPTDASGYLAEVEVLTAQNALGEAERTLRDAIQKTSNPALVMNLYRLLQSQGRTTEAESFASHWAQRNPKDIVVPTLAGELSMQRKDYAASAHWYESVLKAQPNNILVLNNLAWVLGQLHDPSALEYGQKALSLAPDGPAVLDTVGWLYVEKGDVTRGLELLNKAHNLAPNVPSIQLNLAKALIKAGQAAKGRQHLEALTKLPANNPERKEAEKLLTSS